MRSEVIKRIRAKTPKDVDIFVRLYADIVLRVNQLLEEKGYTQKSFAEKLGKKPSEINKWLSGEHNFTLRSIAKLEAELGETILSVPKKPAASSQFMHSRSASDSCYKRVSVLSKQGQSRTWNTKTDTIKYTQLTDAGQAII